MKDHDNIHASARHGGRQRAEDAFDLDAILHPGRVFARPADVLRDPRPSLAEKRAILASWASDACAVEAVPALRAPPGSPQPIAFDEVMDALRALDAGSTELVTNEPSHPRSARLPLKRALRRRFGLAGCISVRPYGRRRSASGRDRLDA